MNRALLLPAMALNLLVPAGVAHACADSSRARFYFSDRQPSRIADLAMLRISIAPADVRNCGIIRARLLGTPTNVPNKGSVLVRLDQPAEVTNCIHLGPTAGPVFVVGRLQPSASGELMLVAMPTETWSNPSRRTREPAFYDQYIVDPAYLTPEERRRREERRK